MDHVGRGSYGQVVNMQPVQGPGQRVLRDELAEVLTRLPLFFTSYMPLFLILAVRFEDPRSLQIVCVGLAVTGLVLLLTFVLAVRKTPTARLRVESAREAGAEAGGYLASYVLPFVTVSAPTVRDMIGYGIFMLVVLLVYVRSNLVQVNPTFYLLLRRVVRIRTDQGDVVLVVCRQTPRPGETLRIVSLAGIRLEVGGS
jgi:hypothetical protein